MTGFRQPLVCAKVSILKWLLYGACDIVIILQLFRYVASNMLGIFIVEWKEGTICQINLMNF